MDFFTVILIAVVLGTVGFFILRYLQSDQENETPAEYSFGILAQARKEELEARKKQLSEKEQLEQNWRFGIRTFEFFENLIKRPHSPKPPGFNIQSLPDPYDRGNPAPVPAFSLVLQTEEGEFKTMLYDRKYSPDWLKRLDSTAFFRIVEVQDSRGKTVFRVLLRFLIQDGAETFTGSVLEELEHGAWVRALRSALTESEKARGVVFSGPQGPAFAEELRPGRRGPSS